ncbi:MAG: amino acid ABC transporter substrate-binding protein [Deltaproteobacteria bacterium]|nr:amino acid ABC transporter substrate-binding protein [Deltaproteobacteria bacterium]MBW2065863.1 amino acid ABC transporter substrate-binding protein [Deltaproteobacteria bacterium]
MKHSEKRRGSWGKVFIAFVVAVMTLGLTVAPSSASTAPETIKLGCVISLTGPFAIGGSWIRQGYDIAVKHINETGGVYVNDYGKRIPLEIVYLDNESNPRKTSERMEKLYSVDKVHFFLGGFAQFLIVPQLAIAEKYKVPFIGTTIGSTAEFSKGYRYIFTPFMSEQDQVTVFLDVLDSIPEEIRPRRIAYFQVMEEWGVATGRYLKKFAAERGYRIVTFEQYAIRSNDFSSLIVKAKQDKAEVLYTCPTPPQGIRLIKQMKELNWSPKLVDIMRAADVEMWAKNLGKDGDYVIHTGGWDYHLKLPGVERFNRDYRAAYKVNPTPPSGSAYACIQIFADAIERAGALDREKVRDAIASTNMMTIMGPMSFKPNGRGQGKYVKTMSQWQYGKDELIWPKDQASAELLYPALPWDQR